ncbi:MAG: hypothetical protein J0I09_04350 [Sphingobacteriia bacterium]|nr:hypothetical protein [Sphingobacteriia bacterium]
MKFHTKIIWAIYLLTAGFTRLKAEPTIPYEDPDAPINGGFCLLLTTAIGFVYSKYITNKKVHTPV